jgi:glycosyltransferase involved in cell wall biosynthesis
MNKMNTSPHILLVIRNPVGGIRTYINYVYTTPIFHNYRFTMILPESHLSDLFIETLNHLDAEFILCDKNSISMMSTLISVLRKSSIDLIHSHGFTSGVYSAVIARCFFVNHIITAHDIILPEQIMGFTGKIKAVVISCLFNLATYIHCVSYDVENNLKSMLPLVKISKLYTITNGIDIKRFSQAKRKDVHALLSIPNGYFLIGFLGRFMSQKGFKYLVEAMEIIKDKEDLPKNPLVIAVGEDGFIQEEKEVIKSKGISDSFYFLGRVKDASEIIKGFNVIAMPSLWEACGLVAMEALVAGVPLIASNCIGLREVIEGSPAFIVKPGNSNDIAEAIVDCMNDDRQAEYDAYRKTAMERFDSITTAKRVKILYEIIGITQK